MTKKFKSAKWSWLTFFIGALVCVIFFIISNKAIKRTSTDEYCQSCHIHPLADDTWKKSTHFYNKSGVKVHCVECHLPPKEESGYLIQKARTGLKDLYGFYFKNAKSFDWENKRMLEHAVKIVYNESSIRCHQNLYTKGLSTDGGTAHLYYEKNAEKLNLQCINCHLDVGHFNPNYKHEKMKEAPNMNVTAHKFIEPMLVKSFENYTEQIPNTAVSFNMVAVKGGTFKMGSAESEPFRKKDEGPIRNITVSPFFMSEIEVTWDEYWSFFSATMSEGRVDPLEVMKHNANAPDAVTGPTPPFGMPDQGWGSGKRPAITMTHYAASTYCQWLSKVTGKHYRLPTEAEWEYASRAGTETPYFFPGDPKKLTKNSLRSKLFGADTTEIKRYVVYILNSQGKTQEPSFVKPNPYGLINTLGNVMEYCSDWYAEDAYSKTGNSVKDPKGPSEGTEHVVRGGNYASDARDLRSAARDYTKTADWLKLIPSSPKAYGGILI